MSPSTGKKQSSLSRKVTENTDFTKADSTNKMSESSRKLVPRIRVKGFELESLPSSQLFNSKSDEQEETKTKKQEKIRLNMNIKNDIQVSNLAEGKPVEYTIHQSDCENNELKETADFFRPSPTSFESRHKRFSFGKKTDNAK